VIGFSPRAAGYVGERTWNAFQQIEPLSNGGARLTLKVCRDWALAHLGAGLGLTPRLEPRHHEVDRVAIRDEVADDLGRRWLVLDVEPMHRT
jgi:hypothetical protein